MARKGKDARLSVRVERIEQRIYLIRERRVMLDADLAELYGVETRVLNQAVTRNRERFPADFMFRLSAEESENLNRSQSVIGSQKHRDPRYPPRAFTQEGVAMLSGVLRSKRAVQVHVGIMRAFVRLREILAAHEELAHKLNEMEKRYDTQFRIVFDAIRKLMIPAETKRERIGFRVENE